MYMKFIGEDGSMGLRHGQVYKVKVFHSGAYVYVKWGAFRMCPYESMKSMHKNWEEL